ncbi:MAG: DUF5339 domain-containing protein [Haemophilus parahaemolyticus]|uniref:DUF5339 domain-containing protein n=1 Tax=Haemophilus parahaemolyticus TaxID=735 RepID=UPI0024912356|nr:DUF5339 domain-containing protein [Haemophilus parahaemolyticus]MDQ6569080.1 DUF5339 domain-containing protein [Haemophilus parahaemolyticus]
MLKKCFLLCFSLCLGTTFTISAQAEVKTSTLIIEKPESIKLTPECQNMFNVANTLIKDAEKQPGTHTQVKRLKNQLSTSKKQLLAMETTLQQKSCVKGLSALNTLKEKH